MTDGTFVVPFGTPMTFDNEYMEPKIDSLSCFMPRRILRQHSRADRNRMARGVEPRIDRGPR